MVCRFQGPHWPWKQDHCNLRASSTLACFLGLHSSAPKLSPTPVPLPILYSHLPLCLCPYAATRPCPHLLNQAACPLAIPHLRFPYGPSPTRRPCILGTLVPSLVTLPRASPIHMSQPTSLCDHQTCPSGSQLETTSATVQGHSTACPSQSHL